MAVYTECRCIRHKHLFYKFKPDARTAEAKLANARLAETDLTTQGISLMSTYKNGQDAVG